MPTISSISLLLRLAAVFNGLDKMLQGINTANKLEVLKDARLIGATTTGAASHRALLEAAGVSVLVVEEAGEVRL